MDTQWLVQLGSRRNNGRGSLPKIMIVDNGSDSVDEQVPAVVAALSSASSTDSFFFPHHHRQEPAPHRRTPLKVEDPVLVLEKRFVYIPMQPRRSGNTTGANSPAEEIPFDELGDRLQNKSAFIKKTTSSPVSDVKQGEASSVLASTNDDIVLKDTPLYYVGSMHMHPKDATIFGGEEEGDRSIDEDDDQSSVNSQAEEKDAALSCSKPLHMVELEAFPWDERHEDENGNMEIELVHRLSQEIKMKDECGELSRVGDKMLLVAEERPCFEDEPQVVEEAKNATACVEEPESLAISVKKTSLRGDDATRALSKVEYIVLKPGYQTTVLGISCEILVLVVVQVVIQVASSLGRSSSDERRNDD